MPETNCGFNDVPGGATGSDLLVAYGPTIPVDIGFDPNFRPSETNIPIPGIRNVNALVDSGASESCIDALLASQLNLPIVDRRNISGVGGKHTVNIHMAQVRVPSLNINIYGPFAAVNLSDGGQPHQALLGRTFLRNFVMTYDGRTGAVKISR